MDDAILPMPLVLYHLHHVVPLLDKGYSSNGLLPLPQMCHHIVAGHDYHMGSLCIIPEDTSTTLFPQIHLRCAIMQLCSSNSLSSQLGVALGTDGAMASKKESDTMTMWLWHTMGKHLMKELWSILFTNNHVDML